MEESADPRPATASTVPGGSQGPSEEQPGDASGKPVGLTRKAARSVRQTIRKNPKANRVYRTSVGVVGTATTALGIALVPLPGPGALVALGGLTILGTEFKSAAKARDAGVKAVKKTTAKLAERRRKRRTEAEEHGVDK